MKKIFTTMLALAVVTLAFSQTVLYEENFDDAAAAARWTVGQEGTSNTVDFVYDYTNGTAIPAAPNGGGLGVKFEVNTTVGESSQVYAFPLGESFDGLYKLSFDLWMATDTSGSGTTEFALFGVMHTDELVPNITGYDYAFTCDYGSARDLRIYEEGVELIGSDGEGGYRLGPDGLPLQNMNLDEGLSVYQGHFDGTMPFGQWLQVAVEVDAEYLTWTLNDSLWAKTVNVVNEAGNISIGYADWFSSVASPAGAMYGIYDNVKVVKVPGVGVEQAAVKTISIYPNPASDFLNVEVSENSQLDLINSIGQKVRSIQVDMGKSTVSLENVQQGIYFARFTAESGAIEVHKLVVK